MMFTMNAVRNALTVAGTLIVLAPIPGLSAQPAAHTSAPAPTPTVQQSVPTAILGQVSSAVKVQQPAAIPLANVATEAAAELVYLEGLNPMGAADARVQVIERLFPALSSLIDRDRPELTQSLHKQATLGELQLLEQAWQARQQQLTEWQTALTERADQLQAVLDHLSRLQKGWDLTRTTAQTGNAPPQIIQQIDAMSTAIQNAVPGVDARRGSVLVIQELVAKQLARCEKALTMVRSAQKSAVGNLLMQDAPPLWDLGGSGSAGVALEDHIGGFVQRNRAEFLEYFTFGSRVFTLQAGIFGVFAILGVFMRRRIVSLKGTQGFPCNSDVFEKPLTAAMTVSLFVGSSPLSGSPLSVRMVMSILIMLPMVLLLRTMVRSRSVPLLYLTALLFCVDIFRQFIAGIFPAEEIVLAVEAAVAILTLLWWLKPSGPVQEIEVPLEMRLGRELSWVIIVIQFISLGAVFCGYMRLARLLTSAVLVGIFLALILFILNRVVNGILAVSFRAGPFTGLRMVSDHRELLERRTKSILLWISVFVWCERFLDYTGLLKTVQAFGTGVLTARLQRPTYSISLEEVIAFAVTLWLTFMLASFIRFVLDNDVFPRTRTSAGVSYAVSSLLRYLIVVIGLGVALGEIGLGVNRVIIILSAFSVGIGFGLQNIASNFISGIILLFERPIHVGDAVEFGDVLGNVKTIGLRASKVRSWMGADIIVPNSQLVSDRVVNWTLSDQMRRIDLPVGVNYGADPRIVIGILEAVALANPQIVDVPAPQALLIAYGDSSINFELRAWTGNFQQWPQIRSDLAVAIYDAVQDAGMSFPFPQRDVRLVPNPEPVIADPPCPADP
jgi:potassium efflux system protein